MQSSKTSRFRYRVYEIIETANEGDLASSLYDGFMMAVIVASMIPLFFKQEIVAFRIIDKVTVTIFIIDYLFRLLTADIKLNRGVSSFVRYPFTFLAIIDILSIIPSFTAASVSLKSLKSFRLFRTLKVVKALKVFKAFKLLRYSKSIELIISVIKEQLVALAAVGTLAVGYIFFSAVIVFNVEPDTFENFFEAVYWATVSLTTMGYGDIYPVTSAGRFITMLSSMVGIAIVALPAGIITAGYMKKVIKSEDDE